MNLLEQHFEEALRDLPKKKMSFMADFRLKRRLKRATRELAGVSPFMMVIRQLVAAPLAAFLLLFAVSAYAYESPAVVQGDLLYPVKDKLETFFYPASAAPEQRMDYHLVLSDRRYDEVNTILARREGENLSWIQPALAEDGAVSTSALDGILVETLNRATEQVDLAFLVADETKDPTRLKAMKETIEGRIVRHKDFFQKSGPLLQKVKLQKKPRARHQIHQRAQSLPLLPVPSLAPIVSTASSLSPGTDDSFLEISLPDVGPVLLSDGKDLLEDRLAFEQDLVEKLNGDINLALKNGEAKVETTLASAIESLDDADDQQIRHDQTAINGRVIHYEHQSKNLEKERSPRGEEKFKHVKMRLEKAKMRRNLK